jgi:hypothetical protein
MATRAAWAPHSRASFAEASQPAWRAAALAAEVGTVLRAFRGARPAEPCLCLLKGRDKARSGHTEKEPKQRYPQILTCSGPRPIVPTGRPLGPQSPQALPRITPLPASAPFPPRAPEAPKGRPAQASSRRPEDQPPVQPARSLALGERADRPGSSESPQLPQPRGQVPPLACLRSSDRDLDVPAPNADDASPLGWLGDAWPSLRSGLRPRQAAVSSPSSSSSSSSSSGVSGDGSLGSPSLSCLRRRVSKAARARIRSRARAFSASFFSFFFSAAVLHAARSTASSGTGGRGICKTSTPEDKQKPQQ